MLGKKAKATIKSIPFLTVYSSAARAFFAGQGTCCTPED